MLLIQVVSLRILSRSSLSGVSLSVWRVALGASANLSSAQRQVLIAVKRRGEASADEVAEILGVTPSAVRQHSGRISSPVGSWPRAKSGADPGRPADLYHSTELGEYLFAGPTAGEFSVELLGHIEEEDPELVPRVFQRRRRRRVEQYRDTLAGKPLGEKVAGLAEILDAEGYMADVDELPRQQLPTHAPQLRHLGGRLPLRSDLHHRARIHAGSSSQKRRSPGSRTR